jgi:hypothetical protein
MRDKTSVAVLHRAKAKSVPTGFRYHSGRMFAPGFWNGEDQMNDTAIPQEYGKNGWNFDENLPHGRP